MRLVRTVTLADLERAERKRRWSLNRRFLIGPADNPMLERWQLVKTPWFGIYLHFIYREDLDPVPHDHPWSFWSIVLRGGYHESYHPDPRVSFASIMRAFRRGDVHHFPLSAAHRITGAQPGTTTLVFAGPKVRAWGFYQGLAWIDARAALALRPTEGPAEKQHAGQRGAR